MTSVWLLLIIATKTPFIGPRVVTVDGVVFKTAERCTRNIPIVRKELEEKYDDVAVECMEKKLLPASKA